MAGWMVIVGSVIVVLTAFEQLGSFHTLEVREQVEKFLGEPPGEGLGMSTDTALLLLRVLAMVAAGCATAAAVLGWHVLHRHRPSRIALTVVAVPLFISGVATGGFFSSLVAASALLLWSRPARDWFNGVTRARPEIVHPSGAREPGHWSQAPPPTEPAPYVGFGAPLPPASRGMLDSVRARPDQVLWACVISWAFCTFTAVLLLFALVTLLVDGSRLLDEALAQNPNLDTSGMPEQTLLVGVGLMLVGLLVWAALTSIATLLVWRGREWARIAMVISSGVVAGLSVVALVSSFVTLPLLIAAGVVMRLLLSSKAIAWCRRPAPPRA